MLAVPINKTTLIIWMLDPLHGTRIASGRSATYTADKRIIGDVAGEVTTR
jgi:hypothetical protein